MRAHLGQVIEHLLFATEEKALATARLAIASTRARYARSLAL
jgi:GntR family transcriptional repressor for pyruvate dehydrogenase complex